MKIKWLLTACALGGALAMPCAQAAPLNAGGEFWWAPLTALQIMENSRAAYEGFAVYKGSCSVVSDAMFAVGEGAPTQNTGSASLSIDFERDKHLLIEGTAPGGNPLRAQWTPAQTYLEIVNKTNARPPIRNVYEGDDNLSAYRRLLAGLTGLTGGAGSMLPAALAGQSWSNPFPSSQSQLELRPAQSLGATPCYIVVATNPSLGMTTTYWVEQKSFLLRRITEEQGARTYAGLPGADGKKMLAMRSLYSLKHYIFATTEAR